jgi:hypothetical protein
VQLNYIMCSAKETKDFKHRADGELEEEEEEDS